MVCGWKGHRCAEDTHVVIHVVRIAAHGVPQNVPIIWDAVHSWSKKIERSAAIILANIAGIGIRGWFTIEVGTVT